MVERRGTIVRTGEQLLQIAQLSEWLQMPRMGEKMPKYESSICVIVPTLHQ